MHGQDICIEDGSMPKIYYKQVATCVARP